MTGKHVTWNSFRIRIWHGCAPDAFVHPSLTLAHMSTFSLNIPNHFFLSFGFAWGNNVQAATPEEVKGVKRPHGKDMICTYFLGDNNM